MMGNRSKENNRFMNLPTPRHEVDAFVRNYHKEVITPEIEKANMSTIRIFLTILVETGVMPQDKLDAFMRKASKIAAIENKTDAHADNPE